MEGDAGHVAAVHAGAAPGSQEPALPGGPAGTADHSVPPRRDSAQGAGHARPAGAGRVVQERVSRQGRGTRRAAGARQGEKETGPARTDSEADRAVSGEVAISYQLSAFS